MQIGLRKLISSKTLTIAILGLIVLLVLAFFRDKVQQEDITAEISKKEESIVDLEQERVRLSEVIGILESAGYIEREARLRLGLARPGEKVVSVPDDARPGLASTTVQLLESEKSNPSRWLDYLFGRE